MTNLTLEEKKELILSLIHISLGPGVIDAPIGRQAESIIGRCVTPDGKPSRTEYTILKAVSYTHLSDEVKALLCAKDDIVAVALAHIRHGQMHAGHIDTLLVLDLAVVQHLAHDIGVVHEMCIRDSTSSSLAAT